MIIGNRPEEYLEYALASTKWVNEHIIVNTGNDMNPNLAIVKAVLPNAKILNFSETGLPFTFSNARNYALQNSTTDWILWQDADEVHFDSFKIELMQILDWIHYDAFEFGFYHFLLDVFHYQSVDARTNIFKRCGTQWYGDVHEQVSGLNNIYKHPYRYHHYGYTKPQNEIYENWKLYWSLNPSERYKLNENRNPNDIISDRVTVARKYVGPYPESIERFVYAQKPKVDNYKFI